MLCGGIKKTHIPDETEGLETQMLGPEAFFSDAPSASLSAPSGCIKKKKTQAIKETVSCPTGETFQPSPVFPVCCCLRASIADPDPPISVKIGWSVQRPGTQVFGCHGLHTLRTTPGKSKEISWLTALNHVFNTEGSSINSKCFSFVLKAPLKRFQIDLFNETVQFYMMLTSLFHED